jgi:hypothetical protein
MPIADTVGVTVTVVLVLLPLLDSVAFNTQLPGPVPVTATAGVLVVVPVVPVVKYGRVVGPEIVQLNGLEVVNLTVSPGIPPPDPATDTVTAEVFPVPPPAGMLFGLALMVIEFAPIVEVGLVCVIATGADAAPFEVATMLQKPDATLGVYTAVATPLAFAVGVVVENVPQVDGVPVLGVGVNVTEAVEAARPLLVTSAVMVDVLAPPATTTVGAAVRLTAYPAVVSVMLVVPDVA